MAYTQLTLDMRKKIEFLFYLGKSQAHMARSLGVSRSTISRELDRNGTPERYNAFQAHRLSMQRKKHRPVVLQPKRPYENLVLARLSFNLRKAFWEKKRTQSFFGPEDQSLRMWKGNSNLLSNGRSVLRKPLSFEQKLARAKYLRRRNRDYGFEEMFRSYRPWYGIIRSIFSKVGRTFYSFLIHMITKREQGEKQQGETIINRKSSEKKKLFLVPLTVRSRSRCLASKDEAAKTLTGKLCLNMKKRKSPS